MSHDPQAHDHHDGQDVGFHAPHVVAGNVFTKVIITLLILTVITVAVSRVDFGTGNMLVAMAIAAVKASLVMTFFMHLKWDTAINNIVIISSFLFLSLLFLFLFADFGTRADTDRILIEVPDNNQELLDSRAREMH